MSFSWRESKLFKNIASIGLVQLANYIIPMIILPFVTRALGKAEFGSVSYAQTLITYLTLIVTYGYEYSATQDVALNREHKDALRTIFWTVVRSRLRLFGLTMLILLVLYAVMPRVHENPSLYLAAAMINLGIALYPTWFFQGMEQMEKMAVANFLIKSLGGLLIVWLVTTPADGVLYLSILSLAYVLVGAGTLLYVVQRFDMRPLSRPDAALAKRVVGRGFPIFLNNMFVSAYTIMGITILGFYVADDQLGIYSGSYRIVMAVMTLTNAPINIGLFPSMSRKFGESAAEGWRYFDRSLLAVAGFGTAVSVAVWIFAPLAVGVLLGGEFKESVGLLRLFAVLPVLVIVASLLTVQGLYGLQRQRYAPYVGATVAALNIVLSLLLIPRFGIYGAAYAWIACQVCEIAVSGSILLALRRKRGRDSGNP